MKLFRIAVASLVVFLTACAAPKPFINPSVKQALDNPPADKAQIVFLNPANSISGAFLVGLYDVKQDQRTMYGMLGPMTKLVQDVEPGKHLLMAHTTMPSISHFLEADLEAGKRYYVLLRFVYGHGLQLRPVKSTGAMEFSTQNPKFAQWVAEAKFVDQTEMVSDWYAKFKGNVDEAQAKATAEWQKKDASQKEQLTLNKSDFVSQ